MLKLGDPGPTTDLGTLKPGEEDARQVFGPHLDCELIAYKPDPPDFVLVRGSVVVGWAEATDAADGRTRALFDKLGDLGDTFEAPDLDSDWVVSFRREAKLKDFDQERVIQILALHEGLIDAKVRRTLDSIQYRPPDIVSVGPVGLEPGTNGLSIHHQVGLA